MTKVFRPYYLDQIKPFFNKPIIKVLTGLRRAGKTTMMQSIYKEFLKDIPEQNKIYLNFESSNTIELTTAKSLILFIKEKLQSVQGKVYLFFDEVQMVEHWEQAINSFRGDYDSDIYITGSNSNLLSGKLATLLAGRYVQFEIFPFNFREFKKLFKEQNLTDSQYFEKFLLLGGMPFIQHFNLEKQSTMKYLEDVYSTVILKDVLQFNNFRNIESFNKIVRFAIENIGHTFSANSISKYVKNQKENISVDSILNYLQSCIDAYLIRKIPRYDVLGKEILKVEEKYFLSDHGFREAQGFSNQQDIEKTLENIIYMDLLTRGYKVFVGRIEKQEIDFIAIKGAKKEYFQVSYLLADDETRKREFSVFEKIKDNYPKFVLSMDNFDFSQNGIIHKNIIDFLNF